MNYESTVKQKETVKWIDLTTNCPEVEFDAFEAHKLNEFGLVAVVLLGASALGLYHEGKGGDSSALYVINANDDPATLLGDENNAGSPHFCIVRPNRCINIGKSKENHGVDLDLADDEYISDLHISISLLKNGLDLRIVDLSGIGNPVIEMSCDTFIKSDYEIDSQ